MKKWVIRILGILLVLGIGYFGYRELMKPLPGTRFDDLGRDHVNDIGNVTYNSNPPTSGPHFPVWAKKGAYDRVISDGYLIHSLEHGYIVISYDCENSSTLKMQSSKLQFKIKNVFAQDTAEEPDNSKPLTKMTVFPTDTKSWITPETPPGIEVELPDSFKTDECKALVKDLSEASSKWDRIVIVPRPNMEHPIILTAWRRMETLDSLDASKMEEFIKGYHNRGPEQTME